MIVVCGPTTEPVPIAVAPISEQPGSIRTSGSIATSASIQVDAGSTIVTPASMWRSRICRRASASTRARSTRELTPRITFGSAETWAAT